MYRARPRFQRQIEQARFTHVMPHARNVGQCQGRWRMVPCVSYACCDAVATQYLAVSRFTPNEFITDVIAAWKRIFECLCDGRPLKCTSL